MNKRLEEIIYSKFTSLFELEPRQTAMCFGFECGNGWFKLIYELCKQIIAHDPECKALQVKEKYGTLRFYYTGNVPLLESIIDAAEDQSEHICDLCGERGQLRTNGWMSTRCDKHTSGISKEEEAFTLEKFQAWVAGHKISPPE